jgi:hypothetical protein
MSESIPFRERSSWMFLLLAIVGLAYVVVF